MILTRNQEIQINLSTFNYLRIGCLTKYPFILISSSCWITLSIAIRVFKRQQVWSLLLKKKATHHDKWLQSTAQLIKDVRLDTNASQVTLSALDIKLLWSSNLDTTNSPNVLKLSNKNIASRVQRKLPILTFKHIDFYKEHSFADIWWWYMYGCCLCVNNIRIYIFRVLSHEIIS